MNKRNLTLLTAFAAAAAFAPTAQAAVVKVDSVTVTTTGSDGAGNGGGTPQTKILNTITVGATTYNTSSLTTGTSSGTVGSGVITNLDNFDVNLAGSPNGATFTTSFAGNLVGAQFFILEQGGNDALSVKAIFAGGGTGNSLTLTSNVSTTAPYNWGSTGVSATDGYRTGAIFGLRFNYTDLLDGSGAPLTNQVITGLQFTPNGVDPVSISASLVPEPSAALLLGVAGMTLLVRRRRA